MDRFNFNADPEQESTFHFEADPDPDPDPDSDLDPDCIPQILHMMDIGIFFTCIHSNASLHCFYFPHQRPRYHNFKYFGHLQLVEMDIDSDPPN